MFQDLKFNQTQCFAFFNVQCSMFSTFYLKKKRLMSHLQYQTGVTQFLGFKGPLADSGPKNISLLNIFVN